MNREEAIDAIYAGKKVRHKDWVPHIYMFKNEKNDVECHNGSVYLKKKEGYELFKEPKKECCKEEETEEHPLQSLVKIMESLSDFHKEFFKEQKDVPKPPNVDQISIDQISIDQMYKWAQERWEKGEDLKPDQSYFYNNLMRTYTLIFKENED